MDDHFAPSESLAVSLLPTWKQRSTKNLIAGATSVSICFLSSIGLASVIILAMIGLGTLSSLPMYSVHANLLQEPSVEKAAVNGDCQCSSSSGAVCCCCSHCGCGIDSPGNRLQNDSSGHQMGGNWDIDVGGSGVAGGGYCQCNGQCCCCSSCDCTGPGISVSNSSIQIHGACVGIANCNGDLPARRRALHRRVKDRVAQNLRRRL